MAPRTWRACRDVLPRAEELAGTFAERSGPNCFATVLAAAGAGDDDAWLLQPAFEDWLRTACTRGGRDDRPGTVLVWRDGEGLVQHAAVTIGDGWAMEKPAQTWWTARGVHDVGALVKANRVSGQRLERHQIVAG